MKAHNVSEHDWIGVRLWNTLTCPLVAGEVDVGFYALTIVLSDKKEDELIQDCLKEHMQFLKVFR